MIRPMPSPNGSNYERLFILQGRRPSPTMAFDAAPGAYPDARTFFEGGVSTLSKWAAENLSDKDIEELIERLKCIGSDRTMRTIKDTINGPAMDSRELARWADYGRRFVAARAKPAADPTASAGTPEEEYHARYPNARRLEASSGCTVATTPSAKPIAADTAAEREYHARFPHARRLG